MLKYLFQRIVPTIRSKGKLLSLVFLLFFSCILSTAIAQVTIKEKIELNGLPENDLKRNTSVASALIMPSSGTLQVYYSYVNHFDDSLPDYSTLNSYFFRGDSSNVDSIKPRLAIPTINYETIYDYCYSQITHRWVYYYNSSNDPNEYLYNVGNVNRGDTVQFTYFSDNIETGDTITYGITDTVAYYQNGELVGWDVTFGWYDQCIFRYINVLQVFVGVMKDYDLLVNIEPEILYPGDTASVVIKKLMLQDSSIVDFDSSQTFEVAKLEGCMAGDILVGNETGAYFYDVNQPIYFVAVDSIDADSSGTVKLRIGLVENNKFKSKPKLKNTDETGCFTGNFISTFWKDKTFPVGPQIELISYANGEPVKWIEGNDPTMPVFPVELNITNDSRGGLLIYYLFVKWTNTQQSGSPTYTGVAKDFIIIDPDQLPVIDFNVVWHYLGEDVIVGGDELTLRVIYNGVTKNFNLPNTDILGKNPMEKETFRTYVSTLLQEPQSTYMNITMYFESRFHQFYSDNSSNKGYVEMNTEHLPKVDWGVCQVRKITPTIGEIWNWKENINSGIIIFEDKLLKAENYAKRVREGKTWYWYTNPSTGEHSRKYNDPLNRHYEWYPEAYTNATDFNEEQLLKEMFQRYVSGVYWRWEIQDPLDLNSGKWIKSPSYPENTRGDDAWNIKIGNYPPDWN